MVGALGRAGATLVLALQAAPAWAQPATLPPAPALQGLAVDGTPVTLQALRGRVVLVLVWSTRCPVCMDQMPELRRNLAGWRGRDFVVVALNQDTTEADLRRYVDALAAIGASSSPQLQILWRRAAQHRDGFGDVPERQPATFLIDREGRLVAQARGRWDPELWNQVAEVLLN